MAWTFEVPAEVRFTCSRCGDCCRNVAILLGPGERERLAALPWGDMAPDLAGVATTVAVRDPAFGRGRRLASRPDGACVYLGDQQQCRIHEHFGADAKPLICRLYPFGFSAVGDRIAVDVAFSCRAVSEGMGAPVSDRIAEWAALAVERDAASAPTPRLNARFGLTPDVLWEMELQLAAFLADKELALADRVRCAIEYLRLATTGDPSTPSAAALRAAIARGLPGRMRREPHETSMDDAQRAVFRQWLFLALNPVSASFADLAGEDRAAVVREREGAATRFLEAREHPWIDGLPSAASFGDIAAVVAAPSAAGTEWMATFLSAKVMGQRLLSSGGADIPLLDGAAILFLCHPMMAWTARALAAGRGARSVGDGDVRGAVRLVDRTLGRLATAQLPKKQAAAFEWVMRETDLVACATRDVTA